MRVVTSTRLILALSSTIAAAVGAQSVNRLPDSVVKRVDQLFARFGPSDPGCALGVATGGAPAYTRGYGLANLEYGVPITDATIFESGSVAKQFTAGAIVLLAMDGKLSLEDDIRKYIPEIPTFGGQKITIRNMLNHTSGLRDQWGLLGIEGRGPGTQVHAPSTTVDLIAHQKMLNFPPGTFYLYSNSGYTLLGVVVERVSGKTLDAFTQERLFKPLGMTHTQWRDDFTEVVRNRATAYTGLGAAARTNMSFTNITGNGGLLSTVGDWLIWNENFSAPKIGGKAWVDSMHRKGVLKNGREITYALGLTVASYRGIPEVSHSGSTAGYQTWLGRYPDQHLSVAVMCNTTGANPTQLAHAVADLFLPTGSPAMLPAPQGSPPAVTLTPEARARWIGVYAGDRTGDRLAIVPIDSGVGISGGRGGAPTKLTATSPVLAHAGATDYSVAPTRGGLRTIAATRDGDTTIYRLVGEADTSRAALEAFVGTYASDELDVQFVASIRNGRLTLFRRPDDVITMTPLYKDGFTGSQGLGTVRFSRNAAGKVTGFAIFAGRVLDVRFKRVGGG